MNRTCEKCIHYDVCRYPLEYRAFPDTCWKYEEKQSQWIPCTCMPLPEPYKGGEVEYCPCDTCKHWGENGAIDPYGEEYCPIDHECENASRYEKKEGEAE